MDMYIVIFGFFVLNVGVIKCQQCNTNEQADVVMLIDGSSSVGGYGFSSSLDLLVRMVKIFKIGPADTQFGLVIFGVEVDLQFYLNSYTSVSALETAISNTPYPDSGGTNTQLALDFARFTMFSTTYGRRSSATHIAILVTDGQSSDSTSTISAATALKNTGVTVYAAGVSGYDQDELLSVVSDSSYLFATDDYSTLFNLAGPLALTTCEELHGCLCENNGTCPEDPTDKCLCSFPYDGWFCHQTVCQTETPCVYGSCHLTDTNWYCLCKPGFTGHICDIDIDECEEDPCQHSATCIDYINRFYCSCVQGYTGNTCETDIDDCDPDPCVHGSCTDHVAAYSCTCEPGWTGQHCSIDINECLSSPCENGGICFNGANYFLCDCPPRYYGIYCETGICQPSVADIVFVLDSSASQTVEDYSKQLAFINKFIDHVVIGENDFQIAVITYSFEAKVEVELGQYNINTTLKDAVNNIQFRPGATFTDKGLEAARSLLENTVNIRPYNKTARRYVFVLTDGMSTYRQSTKVAAKSLRVTVNKVIAIGIGSEVSHQELLDIASPGDHRSPQYVFSVNNFNALYTIVSQLVDLTCDECYWNTSSDVLFLVDQSVNMSVTDFEAAIEAMTYLLNTIIERDTKEAVRISLVTYGATITTHHLFEDPSPKEHLVPYIQSLTLDNQYCHIDNNDCHENSFGAALDLVNGDSFTNAAMDKNNTREIIIILTNGKSELEDETKEKLERLKETGKFVFAIALGDDVDMSTMQLLVNDPAFVYFVQFQEKPTNLDALIGEVFYSSCALSNNF